MRIAGCKKPKINFSENKNQQGHCGSSKGGLTIVGIGPGSCLDLTSRAIKAIRESEVVVGYKTYVDLLGDLTSGKEIVSTGMCQEIERAQTALDKAASGKKVCIISSGDPGIYGMAGVVLELLKKEGWDDIKVAIISGITAASSCAAILGAPLMNDFAVISLSDLLTTRKEIEKRIEFAAKADFVIVFYNPKSKKRTVLMKQAWRILLKYRPEGTPVGVVRNAGRPGQKVSVTTLGNAASLNNNIDMVSTVIVGNSRTYIKGRYMITPRGYRL